MTEPIGEIRNARGERLDFTFTPGAPGSRAVCVVGHGVTSHRERPNLIALSEALRDAGIASLGFSFAGNGASEGRFEECTISKEVEDLGSVIDALSGFDVAYAGHSMGGAVGVLRAAGDARIRALVSLAGMVRVDAFMRRVFGHLKPGDPMLDKPHCPLGRPLLDDAAQIGDVLGACARVRAPWLLIHGDKDELVPLEDSVDAVAAARETTPELQVLEGVDHRFTGREDDVAVRVVEWLRRVGFGRR